MSLSLFRNIAAASLLFLVLGVTAQEKKLTSEEYIELYYPIAVAEMEEWKIPASITLAQGILESGNGNSALAKNARNHFGIKCHKEWQGEGYYMDDDEADECFRVYDNPEESYHDHSLFLTSRSRYSALFDLKLTDYKNWAKGLKKAGYATNPKYADLLISIIERYDLMKYDKMTSEEVMLALKEKNPEVAPDPEPDPEPVIAVEPAETPGGYNGEVFLLNNIKTIIVREGETPLSIAVERNVPLNLLLKYNDLTANEVLPVGSNCFLQPKRKKGYEKTHVVREGESMHAISQMYGIKLKKLYERNLISGNVQPIAGQMLYLRKESEVAVRTMSYEAFLEQQRERMNQVKQVAEKETVVNTVEKKPEKEDSNVKSVVSDGTEESSVDSRTHVVAKGDTLYSISKRYNVNVTDIQTANALDGAQISPGQELQIPVTR